MSSAASADRVFVPSNGKGANQDGLYVFALGERGATAAQKSSGATPPIALIAVAELAMVLFLVRRRRRA